MHFAKYSGFIKHIECTECPKITQENAAARCKKSLEFAKALGKLDAQRPELLTLKGPKDFGPYLGGDPEPIKPISQAPVETSPWCTQDSSAWGSSGAEAPSGKDFPTLGQPGHRSEPSETFGPRNRNKIARPEQQQQQATNAWSSTTAPAKTLFPNAAPAQAPTQEQLESLRAHQDVSVERARADHADPDHPSSRYFDAKRYWNAYTKRYKCSRGGCR